MEPAATGFGGTDRFQLLRVIGRGGMGVVYEARDLREDRIVALKALPNVTPDRLLRFKREFRAVAELHHDNLVRLGALLVPLDHMHGEWWREAGAEADLPYSVRDYFQVEVIGGGRYWLFRLGDGETAVTGSMRWFIHGAFA